MINIDATDKIEGIASIPGVIEFTCSVVDGTTVKSSEGVLSDSQTQIYLATAVTRVLSLTLVNTHSSAVTVNVQKDPGDAGTLYRIIPKDLILGIGYMLVFDGQRCTVMDVSGRLLKGYTNHASEHTDGTDDIQSATTSQKGLATDNHITAIEANTTASHAQSHNAASHSDITSSGSEIESAVTASHSNATDHANTLDHSNSLDHAENHKTRHQDGGADEISVTALSGTLADDQHVIDAEVTTVIEVTPVNNLATADGDLDMGTHNIVNAGTIALDGGQIAFPATAVPSADPNTLDDYEEGTYTVTLTCGTSGTITLNSSVKKLKYTKIARIVIFHGRVNIVSVSSPLGRLLLSIPFTTAASGVGQDGYGAGAIIFSNINAATVGMGLTFSPSSSSVILWEMTTTGTNDVGATLITNGVYLYFNFLITV